MPSGKTHDTITYICAPPVLGVSYLVINYLIATGDQQFILILSFLVTAFFIFGGLMFGPDLDTVSVQYKRWGYAKLIWYPYKKIFSHRSKFTHGLLYGTSVRVLYFSCTCIAVSFVALVLGSAAYYKYQSTNNTDGDLKAIESGLNYSHIIFSKIYLQISPLFTIESKMWAILLAVYIGLWLGAASHTIADTIVTFVKTGKVKNFW